MSAYEQGRRRYEMWRTYGGNKEGVFLTGVDAYESDDDRAEFEEGWIDAAEELEG